MSGLHNNGTGWRQLFQGAPLAVLVAAALYILYQLLPVLKLIAIVLLIAVILRTVLRWMEKLVKVRWIAVVFLFSLIVGFLVFLASVVVPGVLEQAQILLLAIPTYLNNLIALSTNIHHNIAFFPDLSQGLTVVRNFTAQVLNSFPLLLQQAFSVTIEAVAMVILALYIAYDPHSLIEGGVTANS